MNDVCFLIQCNLLNEIQINMMVEACQKNSIPYELYRHIPFSMDPIITETAAEHIIPYGSTSMVSRAHKQGLKGCYFNENFNHKFWRAYRNDLLNQDALVLTVEKAREYIHMREPQVYFIRPVDDLKAFSGQTIWSGDFAQWLDNISHGGYTFGETKEIVVGEPQNIKAEWRYFIVNGKIIDGSMYRRMGQMHRYNETDEKTLAEAQRLADIWLPHPNVVMDLALVGDDVKVIEFNCINGSGFYDHNIEKIVKALYEGATNE